MRFMKVTQHQRPIHHSQFTIQNFLFNQHHFLGLYLASALKAVQVDAGGEVGRIEGNGMGAG